ncbi:thymidylate kinase [Gloeomargarita lithophora Alchichica-D10]|uniref:Thymidylate kinase n=1 Tax=Gloeomargarita lithophora Alchichica-D10 TaxID=1188229 RepID=A0A1J0ACB4_9CYAN|nr:dTMP kinase [Gloeomargarita lithophora]APB33565.1 thymidylate kinase [Gloeomargarita lithophora Alchichica-D10]
MTGWFISLEGIEGAGKTTQTQLLAKWLSKQGYDVLITHEPGGTPLGQSLRTLLLQHTLPQRTELLLYAADRATHVAEVLQPALQSNKIILCDRYTDSTVAYQGYGRGLSLTLIDQVNALATGGLTPDLTLWLDVPVPIGLARAKKRGVLDQMERESLAFHERVRSGYQHLTTQYPERLVRIAGELPVEQVFTQICAAIAARLSRANECQ